jgi:hypothetical protein
VARAEFEHAEILIWRFQLECRMVSDYTFLARAKLALREDRLATFILRYQSNQIPFSLETVTTWSLPSRFPWLMPHWAAKC